MFYVFYIHTFLATFSHTCHICRRIFLCFCFTYFYTYSHTFLSSSFLPTVPPTRLTILDHNGAEIRDQLAGPYLEGESVNLTCLSSGGVPPPRVSWWREHALVDDSFHVQPDGTVRNILHLKNIERKDLLTVSGCLSDCVCEFVCVAKESYYEVISSSSSSYSFLTFLRLVLPCSPSIGLSLAAGMTNVVNKNCIVIVVELT